MVCNASVKSKTLFTIQNPCIKFQFSEAKEFVFCKYVI